MAIHQKSPGPWYSFVKRKDNLDLTTSKLKSKFAKEQLLYENYLTNFSQRQQFIFNQKGFSASGKKYLTNDDIRGVVKEWGINPDPVEQIYGKIENWDVSRVIDFSSLFDKFAGYINDDNFNKDISKWNMSSATTLESMFLGQNLFNQPIGSWDVSSVTNMRRVFTFNDSFDQNINSWDVSNVTDMFQMFAQTKAFNQPLNNWDVSKVTTMGGMFLQNSGVFDQDLGSWEVASLTSGNQFLKDSSISTANYTSLLIGWESKSIQNNVILDAGTSQYTSAAAAARQSLVNFGWTITDGGEV
jgi:surface protein